MPRYSGIWTLSQVNQAIKNLDWEGVAPTVVEYLIVAGGGGGGSQSAASGGGGGGGGLLQGFAGITAGSSYFVTVGGGGNGGNPGTQGGASVFDATSSNSSTGRIVATGGGYGGAYGGAGTIGGSGGGGGQASSGTGLSGGAGISGQGNSGGSAYVSATATYPYGGAGGGGAGTLGLSPTGGGTYAYGGTGGAGIASDITGIKITYAGGGAGASHTNVNYTPQGGVGGGGNGANQNTSTLATAGTPNTGGGGGGNSAATGLAGGSGIVVIRYPGNVQYFTGGTLNYSNGFMVHTFYSSGTLAPIAPRLFASPDYQIQRSLRFNTSNNTYFNKTFGTATSRQRWTLSFWTKRSGIGTGSYQIFASRPTGTPYGLIYFNNNTFQMDDNGSCGFNTTQVFRDTSAWYHLIIAVDTTQTTSSDRIKVYVNGSQITTFTSTTYPTQNYQTQFNTATNHTVGRGGDYTAEVYDGYLTELNFVDGQQLTPNSFGYVEPSTGVWTPLQYVGSYGTNGFYLNFADNSGITATTLGKDLSGNANNWTPNNFSVTAGSGNSSLVDTPTNYGVDTGLGGEVRGNYCTLNPLQSSATLANGNLSVSTSSAAWYPSVATMGVNSGKWYWEILINTDVSVSGNIHTGIVGVGYPFASGNYIGNNATSYAYRGDGNKFNNSSSSAYGASFGAGTIIGVALDMDTGTITFYKNGTSQGTAFSSLSGTYFPATSVNGTTTATSADCNFGQRPFAYTAPSGFKALCTQNLPNPAIMPQTAFAANAFASSLSSRVIGTGIQSDLVWSKRRDATGSHLFHDAVRGAGKTLYGETTSAEVNNGAYYVQGFNSDSYSIGSSDNALNGGAGATYVSWTWNAGGVTVTNTAGSVTSQVRANPATGFSIVTYSSAASAVTVGHGLGVAPNLIIVKARGTTSDWFTYHSALGATQGFYLNQTLAAITSANFWNNVAPTSTVFTNGTGVVNGGNTAVAYCWAEVAGYSKFGSYVGNGSADGPFVYCGFRPRFVMIKVVNLTWNWFILDTTRSTTNLAQLSILPNNSTAELNNSLYSLDILSNGFKVRTTDAQFNGTSSDSYIFAAFAESPLKYARAR